MAKKQKNKTEEIQLSTKDKEILFSEVLNSSKPSEVLKQAAEQYKVEIKLPLSSQAVKWKVYLKQLKVTPQEYLKRFPEHTYKKYIEELI